MEEFLREYLPVVVFLVVAIALGAVFLIAAAVLAVRNPDPEKVSAYECGFNAFDDARMKFDVRFYLVSILFIIFDLEIAFLFPWAVAFKDVGLLGFWSMMVFLAVLTDRLRLRMEEGGAGMGVMTGEHRGRRQGRLGARSSASSWPTRASCSPPPTTSSPGRAPARCTG